MKKRSQSGQVLLIIVMILATVLAVTFSLFFTSQTDTKTAKLEEDSKRALAAAQAILEASLKNDAGTYTLAGLGLNSLSNENFSGSATVAETTGNVFTTPLLQKDEQYAFYASSYTSPSTFTSVLGTESVYLYLKSEQNCPALELTYVHTDNSLTRNLVDPCTQISGTGKLGTLSGETLNGVPFAYKIDSPIDFKSYKLVLMRVLFNPTKIGVEEVNNANLPSQGKTTTAQAQTSTNVASTISLFQSYPQIPSDFFVTSF